MTAAETETPDRPPLRVVRGEPTPEELAVLTAVVTAAVTGGGGDGSAPVPARGRWADPAWQHRRLLLPGPGGWRAALR